MNLPKGWPTEEMIEAGKNARMRVPEGALSGQVCRIIFEAMIEVAPTPTEQVTEDMNRNLLKEARKHIMDWWVYGGRGPNALPPAKSYELVERIEAAIATPPAQEAEPVAWMDKNGRVIAHRVRMAEDALSVVIEQYNIPLYTRPQSDELRKAAERLLKSLDNPDVADKWLDDVKNLRAALEEK